MTLGISECNIGKCGASCKHQYLLQSTKRVISPNFIPIFDPAEPKKFAYIALGETGDDYLYEGLHDSVVDIVGDVDLLIAPVILTCHFEGATPEAISSNRTDGRFLESLKSDVLLNLDNAYRILRERERERERERVTTGDKQYIEGGKFGKKNTK